MGSVVNVIFGVSIGALFLGFWFSEFRVGEFVLLGGYYSVTFGTNEHLALSFRLEFGAGSLQLFGIVHGRVAA